MDIVYRKATVNDIALLTAFRQKQLSEEGAAHAADIAENITGYFLTAMQEGSFTAWVAEADGKTVASCGMCFYKKPPYYQNVSGGLGEVCSVYTEKEYRRKGIAKTLLSRVMDEAAARGVYIIRVSASEAGSRLYRNFGFTQADNFFTLALKK